MELPSRSKSGLSIVPVHNPNVSKAQVAQATGETRREDAMCCMQAREQLAEGAKADLCHRPRPDLLLLRVETLASRCSTSSAAAVLCVDTAHRSLETCVAKNSRGVQLQ